MSLLLALSFLLFLFSLLSNPLNPGNGKAEKLVFVFLIGTAWVSLSGIVLSGLSLLGSKMAWSLGFVVAAVPGLKKSISVPQKLRHSLAELYGLICSTPVLKVYLIVIIFIFGIRNIFTHPYNWDSLTCHIPRVLYYIQAGKYEYLGSSYWALDVHPINYCSSQIIAWLILPKMQSFNSLSAIGFLVFWVELWIFLGWIPGQRKWRLITASLLWFGTNSVISFVSTQNDIWLAPVLFGSFLMLIRYGITRNPIYAFWGIISLANAFGIKQTTLLYVVSWLPLFYLFRHKLQYAIPPPKWIVLIFVFSIPIGLFSYIKNYKSIGHFVGYPEVIRAHGSITDIAFIRKEGALNLIRYGFDMLSFDGFYFNSESQILASKVNQAIKKPLYFGLLNLGFDLEKGKIRDRFYYAKRAGMDDSRSYYGILGVALYLPVLLLGGFFAFISDRKKILILLYTSLVIFFIINSVFSTYDQGRCRHLIHIFPVFSAFIFSLTNIQLFRTYTTAILFICGINIFCVGIFDERRKIFGNPNIFNESKFACLKENRFSNFPIFEKMEEALAPYHNIALKMPANSMEIFYFGENHDKNPKHFFTHGFGEKSVPSNFEVLMYCNGYCKPMEGDRLIGELNLGLNVYLRILKK